VHAEGLAVFDGVIGALEAQGWTRLRVDTLQHPQAADLSSDVPNTVRHHYSSGVWELYFEPDAYWRRGQATAAGARQVRIRLDRPPLPTVPQVLSELFGPRYREFVPEAHRVNNGKAVKS
jgi:hypothetical protein